jgi:hypothetical protein
MKLALPCLLLLLACGVPPAEPVGAGAQAVTSTCSAEGVLTCSQGLAVACWPAPLSDGGVDRDTLLRSTLGPCGEGQVAAGAECELGDTTLFCAGGATYGCWRGQEEPPLPDGGMPWHWTRYDPHWFRCTW